MKELHKVENVDSNEENIIGILFSLFKKELLNRYHIEKY